MQYASQTRDGYRDCAARARALVLVAGKYHALKALVLSLMLIAMAAPLAMASDRSPIVVSQDHAWPPFSYINGQGEPEGLLIDLWQAIAEELDRPIEFMLADWPDSIQQVRDGRADVHGGLFQSTERAQFLSFSDAVLPLSAFIFVSSRAGISSRDELATVGVGVVAGSYELEHLRTAHPELSYTEFSNNELMIKAAVAGELAAFIGDYPVAMYLLDRHAEPGAFHPLTLQYEQQLVSAVALEENNELLGEINAALVSLDPETHRRIQQRWLRSESIETVPPWFWPALSAMGGGLLLSLVGLLLWQRRRLTNTLRARTHHLRESEAMFRTLAENAAVGIYIVRDSRFEFVNPAMANLVGYSVKNLLGVQFEPFIHPDDAPEVLALSAARLQGEELPKQHNFRINHLDGSIRHVQVSGDRILLNHEPCIAGTVIDITQHMETLNAMASEGQFNQLLANISAKLLHATADTFDQQLRSLLALTGEAFQADRAYLFRFNDDITTMTNTHDWVRPGAGALIEDTPIIKIGDFRWWRNQMFERIVNGRILTINDVQSLPPEAAAEKALLNAQGVESMLCIPITTLQRSIGFIGFDSLKPRSWPEDQAAKLATMADLLSDSLSRMQTEYDLTQSAITDPLTGLFNRRHLASELNHVLQKYRETGELFSVVVLDIDVFKILNDSHGHAVGDDVLKTLADRLTRALRQGDLIARYGGEEFVVVLTGCSHTAAVQQADRLLTLVREEPIHSHGQNHHVTLSAGVACVSELAEPQLTTTNLIELADERLYAAKRAGRDRTVSGLH